MTVEQISKIAGNESKPSDEMDYVERCLFWELNDIYGKYKSGMIGKSEGERLKKKAIDRFIEAKNEIVRSKEILEHHAKMWREIERTAGEYNRNPTIENADAFVKAVYGVGRKETENG